MTGCWVRSLKALPMARARMSKADPADSGTMMRRDSAVASPAAIEALAGARSASAKLTHATTGFMHDAPEVSAADESKPLRILRRIWDMRIKVLSRVGVQVELDLHDRSSLRLPPSGWSGIRSIVHKTGFIDLARRCGGSAGRVVSSLSSSAHFASGSGRSWKCTAIGFMPLPPSISHGVRSPLLVHNPRPFQPALASSMRPSKPLA